MGGAATSSSRASGRAATPSPRRFCSVRPPKACSRCSTRTGRTAKPPSPSPSPAPTPSGGGHSARRADRRKWPPARRSEEHTSELQSLAYLVCRLLLEKKKKKIKCRLIQVVIRLELTNT